MEALHQQLRAITINGQAARAFLAAMEQTVAVGALLMQLGKQGLAVIEGDAERLDQGRHATRLGLDKARKFISSGAICLIDTDSVGAGLAREDGRSGTSLVADP